VAAVNGACLGGGLELALACHIRVCSEKARLGLPELSVGLVPGLGGIPRLVRVVGEAKALEMMLLGDIVSADDALRMHLVSRVFPRNGFRDRVLAFVRTILATRQEGLRELLALVPEMRGRPEAEAIRLAGEGFARVAAGAFEAL
jgi:enoyl-CoA hydratase/carnithine racemase